MATELFSVSYRAALHLPPVTLLCQAIDLAGEKFLWIDGLNVEDPVVVPIASVRQIEWAGSFRDFMSSKLDLAEQVIGESDGEHSPTIMARAMLSMSRDGGLTAADALLKAENQALDLIDADSMSSQQFSAAREKLAMTPSPSP